MIEHVTDAFDGTAIPSASLPKKKAGLWTPWGSQRVPDLDKALESPVRRPAAASRVSGADSQDDR